MDEIRIIHKSKPIAIQQKQYSLNNMSFDPTSQNSPPSVWKVRLNKRVGDSPIKHTIPLGIQ